jgi:hypothetical protein
MTHPSSIDLEAFAVGEPLPAAFAGHVEGCAECAAFVAELHALVSAGPSRAEAEDVVSRAALRAALDASAAPEAANDVTPSREERKKRLWLVATSVLAPLAAAAAILFLVRSEPLSVSPPPAVPTVTRIQMAPLSSAPAVEPDTQFKGGRQVAVVRERAGDQARFSGSVAVRPGDRIRVEVALDHEQAILGAVLGDDGSYLELMPDAVRGPGTHFSEKSAKFDASPTHGTIIVGSREAVARARATRQLDGVATVRIEWESQ